MTLEEMKQVVREQRAGYEAFHRFEVQEWRKATFPEKLRDYAAIIQFAERIPQRAPLYASNSVAERWEKIRARYHESVS
ncbi:MAG: hypothetical protein KGJ62_09185 [Armatimonadetes bacterium]|nr:hypothetical protein [Armatimonadota bacterium]MDE2207587.1 hypothetical protein [Armatimonadota bacterium]